MIPYTDDIINTVNKLLPQDESAWELVGFINKEKNIYTFGNDSKIIGRLFEVIIFDTLNKVANELGYILKESEMQTVYPDFYFIKPDGRKIAIDVKTTYRRSNNSRYGFTGGSFTSFMRNGTKNIVGNYSDYDQHYILGVVYTRESNPTTGNINFNKISDIIPAYKNIEVFIQEKYRICGDKKGSGNTDNIGTIKANSIEPFVYGAGPFSVLGEEVFHDYWVNHPKYTDSPEKAKSLFNDLASYIEWVRKSDSDRADELNRLYNLYKYEYNNIWGKK